MPLVADSAAALGARHQGRPVATQAAAHAYSLSFAKVVSAGGGGGALVLPADAVDRLRSPVDWLRSVPLVETAAVAALDLLDDLDLLVARRRAVAARYTQTGGRRGRAAAAGGRRRRARLRALGGAVRPGRPGPAGGRAGSARRRHEALLLAAAALARLGSVRGAHGPLPVSDALGREALALPMSSELSPLQADRVTMAVLAALSAVRR